MEPCTERALLTNYEKLNYSYVSSGKSRFFQCCKCQRILKSRSIKKLKTHRSRCDTADDSVESRRNNIFKSQLQSVTGWGLVDGNGALKCPSEEDQEPGICVSTNYGDVLSSRRELEKSSVDLSVLGKTMDVAASECENSDSTCNDDYHRSQPGFDPNVLVGHLRLLVMSQTVGHRDHSEEISAIIQELKSARIIA